MKKNDAHSERAPHHREAGTPAASSTPKHRCLGPPLARSGASPSKRHEEGRRWRRDRAANRCLRRGTRPRHAVDAEMGTPVLVGARGGKGATRRLVRAAVDLGLELRRDGIQGLLEVRVITTTVRLLEAFPG